MSSNFRTFPVIFNILSCLLDIKETDLFTVAPGLLLLIQNLKLKVKKYFTSWFILATIGFSHPRLSRSKIQVRPTSESREYNLDLPPSSCLL